MKIVLDKDVFDTEKLTKSHEYGYYDHRHYSFDNEKEFVADLVETIKEYGRSEIRGQIKKIIKIRDVF